MKLDIELLDALRLYHLLNEDTVGHERSCVCRPCARRKSWAGACLNLARSTDDHDGILKEVARDVA